MTQPVDTQDQEGSLRAQIRAAFPGRVYSGAITSGDGQTGEDYDEPEALYDELRGKSWPDISGQFVRGNAHGLVFLTVEAFVAYLPAWLIEGIADPALGEVMVYTFCPDDGKDRHRMDHRIEHLSSIQKEAVLEFLKFIHKTNSSKFVRDHAEQALAYVGSFNVG